MILEFAVRNYRSFRELVTLSMLATPLRDDPELDARNIFQEGKFSLLRSAAIYGANASGKSNLAQALMTMRRLVLNSATKIQAGEKLPIDRFRLDVSMRQQPAYFQVIFLLDGKRYRYGFEADEERVHSEWLYHAAQRETRLFARQGQEFDVSAGFRREDSSAVQRQTRPNALFLSVLAQFNSKTASELLNWFRLHLRAISGLDDDAYAGYTIEQAKKKDIGTAYSNQAFELWYVLHFDFCDTAQARQSYQATLTEKLGSPYRKNAVGLYETGSRRQLLTRNGYWRYTSPITTRP